MSASPPPAAGDDPLDRTGLIYGVAAYAMWGAFPLFFVLLKGIGAFEIVAHRALWGLAFCLVLLPLTGRWRRFVDLLKNRRARRALLIAGFLVAANWTTYVYGVTTDRTLDAALGYFINPIVMVLLAVLVLRERVRPLQWAAIGLGVAAVVVLIIGYGQVPYIALGLAASFGLYGLVKKQVGNVADPLAGMAVETLGLAPFALGFLAVLGATGAASDLTAGRFALLVAAGPLTAVPLLVFAAAAARLPFTIMGLLQYLAPVFQMIVGVALLHEALPPERLAGFVLVWGAIALLVADSLRAARRRGR